MNSCQETVALSVEISEKIYNCMQDFIASNPQWNRAMVIEASMSLFLMQNHRNIEPEAYQDCSKKYLHSICAVPEKYSEN
ncbi:MAG: DUF2811 domain-containing protein [Cyanobacteria bacterium P01_A01_bin.40]